MFIGRYEELSTLNRLYKEDVFQFVVIYGRRRVGKTTLILEFIKDKPHIFFVAQEYDDRAALQIFSQKVFDYYKLAGLSAFENWNKAFEFLAARVQNERLVLVLDEFPYLVNANKSIPSILQNIVDHMLLNSKLFLIVCGSSMSFMEKEALSYKSPLYGRRTSQMLIEPFSFIDSCGFVPNYSNEEKVLTYGILGGIPQYLRCFKDSNSIKENVINGILNKSSYLYEEPRNLLKQELREPMVYNSIIEAIASGASTTNQITTKTGLEADKCLKYIRSLMDLHILLKETPVGEKAGRKSIYKISDNLFKFWYRFVFSNIEYIEQGEAELLYDTEIEKNLSDYIGKNVFEEICKQYLKRKNFKRKLPFVFTKIGRWWGNNPIEKCQQEIDILAFNDDEALFCECKWWNDIVGNDVLDAVINKSEMFHNFKEKHYMLFSKSGFTRELIMRAKQAGNVMLISLDELFE